MDRHRLFRYSRVFLYPLFGLWVFATVFYLTLPFNRFKDWVGARLASEGYELEAASAGPALGLGMLLNDVILVSRPSTAAKPTRILIDQATLSVSPWAYLFGTQSFSVQADVFSGELGVRYEATDQERAFAIQGKQIDLAELPWVKAAINLPLAGQFRFDFDLKRPNKRIAEAKGRLTFTCTGCMLGDGKAKLIVKGSPLLAEGLGLPKIRLGDFNGKVMFDKGVGRIMGMQVKSQDVEAFIEGEITLADPVAHSRVDLYIRIKPSESLLKASEKLRTIIEITAQMGKRPDGFLGFRLGGTLRRLGAPQWLQVSPFANSVPVGKGPSPKAALPMPAPSLPPPPAIPAPSLPAPPPPPAPSTITLPPPTLPPPATEQPPPSEPAPPPSEEPPSASPPPAHPEPKPDPNPPSPPPPHGDPIPTPTPTEPRVAE
jgi:type II secretion system protein N